jgi:hypothetical protein
MTENAGVAANTAREKAAAYLAGVPFEVTSKGNPPLFQRLTGVDQDFLDREWKAGRITTTCNGFTGIYASALGCNLKLGTFWPETVLARAGKSHAWVPAGCGKTPGFGDIFVVDHFVPEKKRNDLHAGVVLECNGSIWTIAEAGQGGRDLKYDIIRKRPRQVDVGRVKGWVNIEALFAAAPSSLPHAAHETGARASPTWLEGWWQVAFRGSTYFYCFDTGNGVTYTRQGIGGATAGRGSVRVDDDRHFTVTWAGTGATERFEVSGAGTLRGRWNNVETLFASFLRR